VHEPLEDTLYAQLVLVRGAERYPVDARPGDALPLASQPAPAGAADLCIAERTDAESWGGVGFAGLDPATAEDVSASARPSWHRPRPNAC
jgi:hypothetical protein